MTSKEALERLGNVTVAVSNIRTGRTFVKTLKEEYEKEFEVLEKELLFVRDIKPFDVYEKENKKLKKVIEIMVDKKVSKFWIVMSESVDRYNAVMGKNYILTQEEYELLKEYFR